MSCSTVLEIPCKPYFQWLLIIPRLGTDYHLLLDNRLLSDHPVVSSSLLSATLLQRASFIQKAFSKRPISLRWFLRREILVQLPVRFCVSSAYCQVVPQRVAPAAGRDCGYFSALNWLCIPSQSPQRRMAQSVVEVMEDAKGKVQENLLANGGRSLKCATMVPSQLILVHSWSQLWPHRRAEMTRHHGGSKQARRAETVHTTWSTVAPLKLEDSNLLIILLSHF